MTAQVSGPIYAEGVKLTSALSDLTPEAFMTLAALCPNLRSLRLDMCGRIDTDTIDKWGSVFPHLQWIDLEGPFLVRVNGWIEFFKNIGDKLKGFLIT